jgi:hypothetical protein
VKLILRRAETGSIWANTVCATLRLCQAAPEKREAPLHLLFSWQLDSTRISFLGTDVAGQQRRVVRREPEPFPEGSRDDATDFAEVRNIFDFAVAYPKADDSVRLVRGRNVRK